MKEETQKLLVEAVLIGIVIGILIVIAVNIFIKNQCMCYDNFGNRYPTTMFKIKKLTCEEQCIFFGERESIKLTNIEPENVNEDWLFDYNYSLEVE